MNRDEMISVITETEEQKAKMKDLLDLIDELDLNQEEKYRLITAIKTYIESSNIEAFQQGVYFAAEMDDAMNEPDPTLH